MALLRGVAGSPPWRCWTGRSLTSHNLKSSPPPRSVRKIVDKPGSTRTDCRSDTRERKLFGVVRLFSVRKLPVRPGEVTGVAVRIALEIVLVLRFRFPEIARRHHLGHDLSGPEAGSVHIGDRVLRDPLLLVGRIEDRRAVTGADVVALAIASRRIVNLEKELKQIAVADLVPIEHDLDRFGVGAMIIRPANGS